jgi:hypothetical protein
MDVASEVNSVDIILNESFLYVLSQFVNSVFNIPVLPHDLIQIICVFYCLTFEQHVTNKCQLKMQNSPTINYKIGLCVLGNC